MREIVDGVFEIRVGFVHVHVVVMDGGLVLVDTGLPRGSGAVEKALAGAGRRIGEVTAVLLTHQHADHVGGPPACGGTTSAPRVEAWDAARRVAPTVRHRPHHIGSAVCRRSGGTG